MSAPAVRGVGGAFIAWARVPPNNRMHLTICRSHVGGPAPRAVIINSQLAGDPER
jgi:hypothetical protein